jgi:hypothetical protein
MQQGAARAQGRGRQEARGGQARAGCRCRPGGPHGGSRHSSADRGRRRRPPPAAGRAPPGPASQAAATRCCPGLPAGSGGGTLQHATWLRAARTCTARGRGRPAHWPGKREGRPPAHLLHRVAVLLQRPGQQLPRPGAHSCCSTRCSRRCRAARPCCSGAARRVPRRGAGPPACLLAQRRAAAAAHLVFPQAHDPARQRRHLRAQAAQRVGPAATWHHGAPKQQPQARRHFGRRRACHAHLLVGVLPQPRHVLACLCVPQQPQADGPQQQAPQHAHQRVHVALPGKAPGCIRRAPGAAPGALHAAAGLGRSAAAAAARRRSCLAGAAVPSAAAV